MNRDHCSSCELGNEQSVSIQKEILDSKTLGLKRRTKPVFAAVRYLAS